MIVCGQGTKLDARGLRHSKVLMHLYLRRPCPSYLFIELHQGLGLFQMVQAEVPEEQVP